MTKRDEQPPADEEALGGNKVQRSITKRRRGGMKRNEVTRIGDEARRSIRRQSLTRLIPGSFFSFLCNKTSRSSEPKSIFNPKLNKGLCLK